MQVRSRTLCAAAMAVCLAAGLSSPQIIAASGDARTLSLYNIHNGERLTILYKQDGKFVPSALDKLNWFFRDWRRNEATKMDPQVFDIAWEIHEELGSKKPIHVVSGFRSSRTNEKLRRSGGGQAKSSQHVQGRAIDLHFPDVPVKKIRYSALVRERGGVGYYPTSALPFVHVDTGRVRMWPRMPRQELALLFPNGRSKYVPADGRPINRADVDKARVKYAQLAEAIDNFHNFRRLAKEGGGAAVVVASVDETIVPPQPQLAIKPAVDDGNAGGITLASLVGLPTRKPKNEATGRPKLKTVYDKKIPSDDLELADKPGKPKSIGGLIQVASADPTMIVPVPVPAQRPVSVGDAPDSSEPFMDENGWAKAPEYDDDDHPGELSYRPFEIAPFLSENPLDK